MGEACPDDLQATFASTALEHISRSHRTDCIKPVMARLKLPQKPCPRTLSVTASSIRLLRSDTFDFSSPSSLRRQEAVEYAILSHTWREDGEEVTLQDMQAYSNGSAVHKPAFTKLQYTSDQAVRDGLDYFWVDSCCIDKTSSAELSEAISSMFRWYAAARVCYVYMSDVDAFGGENAFAKSRWFTRAWTLQELLAPKEVRFYDRHWKFLMNLSDPQCSSLVSKITGIDVAILRHECELGNFSIAQRMSWAAHRQATREEDQAYSLLGIFDVNLPMLYGEGSKAFARLQGEILKISTDHSIFSWEPSVHEALGGEYDYHRHLLAPSPACFSGAGDVAPKAGSMPRPYQMTNRGLEITLPVHSYLEAADNKRFTYAKLNCVPQGQQKDMMIIRLECLFDLDAEKSSSFKPWIGALRRRWREAWDDLMGRNFDWQFVASYARRGFAVGHSSQPSSSRQMRVQVLARSESGFREQTIVIVRDPTTLPPQSPFAERGSANPIAYFNEFRLVALAGIYMMIAMPAIVVMVLAIGAEEELTPQAEPPADTTVEADREQTAAK